MRRTILPMLLGVAIFAFFAWQFGMLSSPPAIADPDKQVAETRFVPRELLGDPLYGKDVRDDALTSGQVRGREPKAVHGHMNVMDKVNLPSPISGQLLFIGTEVPEGAVQAAGVAAFLGEDYEYANINQGDRQLKHFYRRLYDGNVVSNDQMVSLVDPARALGELQKSRSKVILAKLDEEAARASAAEADVRLLRADGLYRNGSGTMSAEEYGTYRLAKIKYYQEHLLKKEAIKVAEHDNRIAEIVYKQHEVRNKIPKQLCQIQTIYRHLGETVSEKEAVLELWNIDRLLAEALIPAQYLDWLSVSKVTLEPVHEQAPLRKLDGHTDVINALAVAGDANAPLILSASEDKRVFVWSLTAKGPVDVLDHDFPVRAVAASPRGKEVNYWLSGDSDGRVHYWKLDQAGKPQKINQLKPHRDAVTSLAISPDGKYFASGGADGAIFVYNAGDEPVKRYEFSPEHGVKDPHQGPVTSLTFTPQGRLVSASLDQTLRVWTLLERGAQSHKVVEKRAGSVSQLGVSADGALMVFDKGKDLHFLSVKDGKLINHLNNPDSSIPFETLALFSPDAKMLLTAGAREGRLQLWRAPTESKRGSEIRQFVPPERAQTVTCAAFSEHPAPDTKAHFVVSGTKDGYVYLWNLPTTTEVDSHSIPNARLKLVSPSQDASGQIRIGVEVLNEPTRQHPNGRFRPGQLVTIVFE